VPELPDITVYLEALEKRILGQTLRHIQIQGPFLLRTAVPPITSVEGKKVVELRRLGKRICIGFEDDLWLVFHLMIAGRLHWRDGKPKAPAKKSARSRTLAILEFSNGVLSLTEAGTQRRASLHVLAGTDALNALDPGGENVFEISEKRFSEILQSANHTLKRALTDPRLFSGIGNAYSDEILFAARLSPLALTQKLSAAQIHQLYDATREQLQLWLTRLREETGSAFPEGVTAFRPEMAVHGRYQQPCPRCGTKIQRIRYASNETNYCPNCQTGGKLLADRSLSRLLRSDWPRTVEELENLKAPTPPKSLLPKS
jgi:formamidopyrimidine-DNA glycosylase